MTRAPVALKRARPEPALPLFDVEALTSALQNAVPVRFLLATQPNDTPAQVRDKEHTLAALSRPGSPLARWKLLANVWCAQWFAPAAALPRTAFAAMSDWVLRDERALPVQQARACADAAEEAAVRFAFLHWELEFPEVFFDAHGRRREAAGFDAVLGNPPWEMIRGDTGTAGHRQAAREAGGAVVRFTRESGTYSSQSDGHANRYQLFVERSLRLLRAGGRMGLVVPSGLSTDHGSAPLRRLLFSRCAIDGIVGFDNAARIFPIHRSVRFQLLTATTGEPTREIPCRLGERDPAILDSAPELAGHDWFPVRISPALLERLTGDDLALPDFRREVDVRIAERASTLFAPLADPQGWGARFGRELNATEDRGELRARERRGFPVVEGKMLSPFCVDQSAATLSITAAAARRLFGERCFSPRLAYRDVASATNRVTLIAAVLPAQTASTHTVFCLRTPVAARHQHFLCGMFNSLVVNYLARLRVTTHVTTAIVERLPIPAPRDLPAGVREIAAIARVLARRNDPRLFARLNARVARMYQLTREEFAHVLGTFPLVPAADRDAALREFERAPRTE
jgi:hypothetical protein